jgi:uncharacterized membrane protein
MELQTITNTYNVNTGPRSDKNSSCQCSQLHTGRFGNRLYIPITMLPVMEEKIILQ